MPATHTADRAALDSLLTAADAALRARNEIESCCSPEWRVAHLRASALFRQATTERSRLFKSAPWGAWMTRNDKALATITGAL
mgnify:CR=1 FL=1